MTTFQKIKNIIGLMLCIIMIPVLSVNLAWMVQSIISPDEIPSVFNHLIFVITTDSMSPEINGGDVVIVREADISEVEISDVISFFDPESSGTSVVTHRVYLKTTDQDGHISLKTKGDANNMEDEGVLSQEHVIGKVVWTIPKLGKFILFLQTTKGMLCFVVIPLLLLLAWMGIRKKKSE